MKYFAFANLMDAGLMRKVCPSATVTTVAYMKDHSFTFGVTTDGTHDGARLIEAEGEDLWGVEYEMSESDMKALDKLAGVDVGHWAHKPVVLHTADGKVLKSVTYEMPNPSGPAAPPERYIEPTLKGARANNLPPAHIAKLEKLLGAKPAGA